MNSRVQWCVSRNYGGLLNGNFSYSISRSSIEACPPDLPFVMVLTCVCVWCFPAVLWCSCLRFTSLFDSYMFVVKAHCVLLHW